MKLTAKKVPQKDHLMKTCFLSLVLAFGVINSVPLRAEHYHEQSDRVLKLLDAGKVVPLSSIRERYTEKLKGRLLDVEIEEEGGQVTYELEILRADSVVYEIKIDAQSGEWLSEEVED